MLNRVWQYIDPALDADSDKPSHLPGVTNGQVQSVVMPLLVVSFGLAVTSLFPFLAGPNHISGSDDESIREDKAPNRWSYTAKP